MTALVWDDAGKKVFETGIDHGVLYVMDASGDYPLGVAWNGLTTVTESPSGAEPQPFYADNIKYLTLLSAEELGLTVEAYTYPDEFIPCDGGDEAATGVLVGQQARSQFGLAYRTKIGNDVAGQDLGYKYHLIYGCLASPSEKAYASVNDSPEAIAFSWSVTTTPEAVTGLKPSSIVTIDSRTADPTKLAAFLLTLFGDTGTDPTLPHINAVVTALT